jgi:hypothetical protein
MELYDYFQFQNMNKKKLLKKFEQCFFFFAWATNFTYNYLNTFRFLTFIIELIFVIFLVQISRDYINLHVLIYAIYLSNIYIFKNIITRQTQL